jgi:DNA invertase Pin-like site-specific DNA recombinase
MKKNDSKKAAIFARSATDNGTITIENQVTECQKLATDQSYAVTGDNVFQTISSGLKLRDNDEFQKLLNLITSHAIDALIIYHHDRLSADPAEHIAFISVCQKNGVQIIPVHGEPIADPLVEHIMAIGKKQQVLRHRAATKAGIAAAKKRKEQSK